MLGGHWNRKTGANKSLSSNLHFDQSLRRYEPKTENTPFANAFPAISWKRQTIHEILLAPPPPNLTILHPTSISQVKFVHSVVQKINQSGRSNTFSSISRKPFVVGQFRAQFWPPWGPQFSTLPIPNTYSQVNFEPLYANEHSDASRTEELHVCGTQPL